VIGNPAVARRSPRVFPQWTLSGAWDRPVAPLTPLRRLCCDERVFAAELTKRRHVDLVRVSAQRCHS